MTNQDKNILLRQGDLLFTKVDEKTEGTPVQKMTIAEGEMTGHHHVLIADVKSSIVGNRTKFCVTGKATLTHPEHKPIDFKSGTYIVTTEREFDYVENTLKKVRD